jgi:hypothetical protein
VTDDRQRPPTGNIACLHAGLEPIETTIMSCPGCGAPAAIEWRRTLHGTAGPVDHVKVSCLDRHWFLLPASLLTAATGGRDGIV